MRRLALLTLLIVLVCPSAARAEDAARLPTNLTGMTQVNEPDLMLRIQSRHADIGFAPNTQMTPAGGDGGDPVGWLPDAIAKPLPNDPRVAAKT